MYLTYLRRELRRRSKQAIVVAIGLAIGIGLVMIVSATSAGVKNAQGDVLHSLYGVGTDMTVTKTATAGSFGGQHFAFPGAGSSTAPPAAGTQIPRNTLRPTPGTGTLTGADVSKISSLHGVAAATGGLTLTDTSFSGTIPSASSGGGVAGGASSSGGSSFDVTTFSVDGVQISKSGVGPITSSQITKGKWFSSSDEAYDVAIVSTSYAKSDDVKVGSKVTVAGKSLSVIGLAQVSSGGADVYIPLGTAQSLSGLGKDVTTIYVSASSASDVNAVASAAKKAVPGATVQTSASLADEVTGSLKSASSLATSLGKWLSIAALIVAFVIAGLLMMAAVSRRVREFGTLKAIGWRTRRVVGQVMGEGMALGILGGVFGLILGIAGIEIVSAISPPLTATVGSSFATSGDSGFGGNGFGGGGFGGRGAPSSTGSGFRPGGFSHDAAAATHTVLVHLSAPLQGGTIGLAIVLAIAGGLVAGGFGAWRAARLRPAAALRRVE